MADAAATLLAEAWGYLGDTKLIWLVSAVFALLVAHLFLLTRRVLRMQADLWETDRVVREIQDRLRETAADDTNEEEANGSG